jgi:hypothetical protein
LAPTPAADAASSPAADAASSPAADAASSPWTALVDLVVEPAALAFLEVGVFVGPLLLLFGWVQWRTQGRLLERLMAGRRAGPLVGAVLGAIPGCGGAIVLMPLWARGKVSFGTVVAALVATMGDSSFVLIAADPLLALGVHALLLVSGLVVGTIVDALGIAPRRADGGDGTPGASAPQRRLVPVVPASTVGAAAAVPRLVGRGAMVAFPSASLVGFWVLIAVGLLLGVPVLTGLTDGPSLAVHLGGVDPVLVVGGAGMALTVAVFASARSERRRGSAVSAGAKASSRRTVLVESARETAFVTVWVALAFVLTSAVVGATGLSVLAGEGGATLAGRAGILAIVIAAAVGLIPGCGPQIVLTGLYVQGALPLSVLAANALSQDGDALIPLLARDRRAAVLGTAISVLPGLLVGGALLAAGY